MVIDITCQKCEGTFDLDAHALIDGDETLECPHCNAKATKPQVNDFVEALSDLMAQMEALSRRFSISLTLESDDLESELDEDDEEDDEEEEDDDEDDSDDDDDEEEEVEEDH